MHLFKDRNGRSWSIEIHVTAIRNVKSYTGVDLYAAMAQEKFKGLTAILGDPCKLVDILYVLCKDEADKAGITSTMFGCAMAGECLEDAAEAFVNELVDFFPDPRKRDLTRKMIGKSRELASRMMDEAEKELANVDMDAMFEKLMNSFGDSPGSSASTPAPSPSDSSPS